jgi:hypothetical protein
MSAARPLFPSIATDRQLQDRSDVPLGEKVRRRKLRVIRSPRRRLQLFSRGFAPRVPTGPQTNDEIEFDWPPNRQIAPAMDPSILPKLEENNRLLLLPSPRLSSI